MIDTGLLRQMNCLNVLTDGQLDKLAQVAVIQSYPTDSYVEKENDSAHGLYVVLKGHVAIEINLPMDQKVSVYMVRRGDLFGWSAAVSPHTITASSICREETELIVIPREPLLELLQSDIPLKASFMEMITQVIRHRLKDTRTQLSYLLGG